MKDLINKNNYLWYFIEYLEGNLNDYEREEVENFLILNPDLQRDFDLLSKTIIRSDSEIKFPEKELLKKLDNIDISSDSNNYDFLCIEYLEGNFDKINKEKFEKKLENNELLKRSYNLYKLTKIQPDLNIKFKEKIVLKKGVRNNVLVSAKWALTLSAVASIILFILLQNINKMVNYFNLNKNKYEMVVNGKEKEELISQSIEENKLYNLSKSKIRTNISFKSDKKDSINFIDTIFTKQDFRNIDYGIAEIKPISITKIDAINKEINFSLLDFNFENKIQNQNDINNILDFKFINKIKELYVNNFKNINPKNINPISIIKTEIENIDLLSYLNLQLSIDTLYNDSIVKMRIEGKSFAFVRTKRFE